MKGIAGFYYVHVEGKGVYECKAKGIFRKEGVKPLVGDNVELDVLDDAKMLGNIRLILPRSIPQGEPPFRSSSISWTACLIVEVL